jgi:hypothetical protein
MCLNKCEIRGTRQSSSLTIAEVLLNQRMNSCQERLALADQVFGAFRESSYLVDPASSHMLVSKIKPCMSKYKQICTVKLRMAH